MIIGKNFIRSIGGSKSSIKSMSSVSSTVRSTTASGSGGSAVYETKRAVDEYLLFHYGDASTPDLLMPYSFGPKEALDFTKRTALLCSKFRFKSAENLSSRCLDIGCSVGGSSFELARSFNEVVGIDFSQHFIDAANDMKGQGQLTYDILKQGRKYIKGIAKVPDDIDRTRAQFYQGDACNLDSKLGTFDVIHASNLLCRLPSPRNFLRSVPNFLKSNGVLVLISPYSWLEEYTPLNEWVGGGSESDSFEILKSIMENECHMKLVHQENIPFLIREHERKFQYGVSDATIWQLAK